MERNCKNCDKLLYLGQHYCPNCGSKWVDYRLTPKKVTKELSSRYLGTDNVFLVTILALLRYPEDVINGYISGMRRKYVNPINFYLISLTLVGIQIFLLKKFSPELLNFIDEAAVAATDNKLVNINQIMSFAYENTGILTTLFLPLYALTGWIVFLDIKKYNFAEHIVFFIYAFGVSNILISLITPLLIFFEISYSSLSLGFSFVYLIQISWYYKRCFQLSVGQTVLKAILASIIFSFIQMMAVIIIAVIAGIIIGYLHQAYEIKLF